MSTEWIDPDEAFAEGENERIARLRAHARPVAALALVGGPRDGGTYRVPLALLNTSRPFSFPIMGDADGPAVFGEYRLDRGMMVLRYEPDPRRPLR
jgi:hypothetical protein